MRTIKYILVIFSLALLLYSCKKEALKSSVCGTVWDKGRDRSGWYLTVDDRQVRVDSVRWINTEVNGQYCGQ